MDTLAHHILILVERLAALQRRAPTSVAKRLGGDSTTYQRLKDGRPITTDKAMRMLRRIREEWPDELPMPKMEGD